MSEREKRFAVLIDSDNISAKYINAILSEMTKYGVTTYKRIYGDWTSNQSSKWRAELLENSITPIQQFSNTVGKNATDSALIIDAMDILYTGNVDGFCLVSSDGDFTKLASRLRETGMYVIGMGESKTPRSFKAACTVFTNLENLLENDEEKANEAIPQKKIVEAIIELITENENNEKETAMGEVGNYLVKKYSDFDVRSYGYSSLSRFIDEMGAFNLERKDTSLYVRLKDARAEKEEVVKRIIKKVKSTGNNGLELAQLGQYIHRQFPGFKVKEYGYSTFQKFVQSVPELLLRTDTDHNMIYYISLPELEIPEKTGKKKR
ncbi:MAG: NYN domain-containing protein [Lachnospiraceae bacterium]|nr:NYN domain-containing protein [Lachnospiraceae bacterium]